MHDPHHSHKGDPHHADQQIINIRNFSIDFKLAHSFFDRVTHCLHHDKLRSAIDRLVEVFMHEWEYGVQGKTVEKGLMMWRGMLILL